MVRLGGAQREIVDRWEGGWRSCVVYMYDETGGWVRRKGGREGG